MRTGFARLTDRDALPAGLRDGVVAIGNFDGVHRGHQAVLGRALSIAESEGCPALVLTFEPHPRQIFQPNVPLFRLTPPEMKSRLVAALGFDAIVAQEFSRDFSTQTAEEFVDRILVGRLGIRHVVTGVDFHFGKGRQGGPAFLMPAGKTLGFGVSLVDSFRDEASEVISSSRIRLLLADGEVGQAAGLLGYRYAVTGEVLRGKQLGRTLGYPTANMALPASNALRHGIYAVRLRRADGAIHDGVASFGRRPTVDVDGEPLLETHLFDFAGDLYGEVCQVSFFGWLRGEEKFDSLEDLYDQMTRDDMEARALLSGVRPLGELDRILNF